MSVVVVLCCCCQNWKKHSAWTSEILSNKLRWNITEKNSSWGKRSCQRVNQAWDKPGRHGFWSQEKFPNLVLRNLKPKKYSTTLSLGRKMAGTSAATWATSASWRNWESWETSCTMCLWTWLSSKTLEMCIIEGIEYTGSASCRPHTSTLNTIYVKN